MSTLPTIISWYGGKSKLARQIISIMPEHQHYVEVFMGSASIFFNKPKSPRNTLNDFNSNLTNLFIQVRDNFDDLAKKVYWTIYSRDQYREFLSNYNNNFEGCSEIDKAVAYLFLIRASFNSRVELGFSASIESNSASFNISLIERLEAAREKLDSVVIENRSFDEIIPKYDVSGSLFYLDPPYYVTIKEKSYYEKSLSEYQHKFLGHLLADCKSPWILSYDDIPDVVELYKNFDIQRISVKYSLGATREARKTESRVREIDELLITNFKCKKPQLDIFDENPDLDIQEVTDEERKSAEIHVKLKIEMQEEKDFKENNEPRVRPPDTKQESLF